MATMCDTHESSQAMLDDFEHGSIVALRQNGNYLSCKNGPLRTMAWTWNSSLDGIAASGSTFACPSTRAAQCLCRILVGALCLPSTTLLVHVGHVAVTRLRVDGNGFVSLVPAQRVVGNAV
jgi:hypothetical protein